MTAPAPSTLAWWLRQLPLLVLMAIVLLCGGQGLAQKPPKEEKPQVLPPVPDAPGALKLDTARYALISVPLEERGLLSKQVEESLKQLRRVMRKRRVVRVTAWVGGAGDVRRVSSSIREQLADWHIPIPTITVIRVGALSSSAARVGLDVEVEEETALNPNGLLFLAGERVMTSEFRLNLEKDLDAVLSTLDKRLEAEGVAPAAVLAARCFVSLSDNLAGLDQQLKKRYPSANARVMQALRTTPDSFANCELTARAATSPSQPLEARIETLTEGAAPVTTVVRVNSPRIVLTSAQLCFRATDTDLALGFERLQHSLEEQGTRLANAAHLSILAQSPQLGIRAEELGRKLLNTRFDPAIFRQTVEGLPALDSTVSLDAVVAVLD
ncbi:MAG: hypothetical protein MUF01_02940 [Bryobacterales bacterium]|jgi:enamine deaminase RidA (YjgF/YER057c/UK114 family)|nr:hypothetical protein [Bryobacterales bacterium]